MLEKKWFYLNPPNRWPDHRHRSTTVQLIDDEALELLENRGLLQMPDRFKVWISNFMPHAVVGKLQHERIFTEIFSVL